MYTDLFRALEIRENRNQRHHPALVALLYAHCPAAAHWWLAGADPVQLTKNYDPIFESMWDYSSEKKPSLKNALINKGFEDLVPFVRDYVNAVGDYRRQNPNLYEPEESPAFSRIKDNELNGFGLGNYLAKIGGRWDNLFTYVKTWVFTIPRFASSLGIPSEKKVFPLLHRAELVITLQGMQPFRYPAWLIQKQYSEEKNPREEYVALLAADTMDPLRFALIGAAGCWWPIRDPDINRDEEEIKKRQKKAEQEKAKEWVSHRPSVFALHPRSGNAVPFYNAFPDDTRLSDIVRALSERAESTRERRAGYPARALYDPIGCHFCGYHAQCFTQENIFSSFALEGIKP